jgi:hypothetical protein
MKKLIGILLIIGLCSLSIPTLVSALAEGYTSTDYQAITEPTIDGKWTTTDEWDDAAPPENLGTDFVWREKWTYPDDIYQHFLIEFFTDSTNDAGDYYEVIYDTSADGGTAPQADDIKVEWKGHSSSGLKIYKGSGSAWTEYSGVPAGSVVGSDTLTTSPLNSNQHWVFELTILKTGDFDITGSTYQPGIRVAVYDASNSAAGVKAWPASSTNAPDSWGLEFGTMDNIPESLTIVAVVVLSSFAVIAGAYFLRKRPTGNHRAVNTGLSHKSF